MAQEQPPPTEIPERLFRQSDEFRAVAAVKAEQRRQARAELLARWPVGRAMKTALIYGMPAALLVGAYWAGKALNMFGGG